MSDVEHDKVSRMSRTRVTFAGETSGQVHAGSVSTRPVHNGTLVDVHAANIVLVKSITL